MCLEVHEAGVPSSRPSAAFILPLPRFSQPSKRLEIQSWLTTRGSHCAGKRRRSGLHRVARWVTRVSKQVEGCLMTAKSSMYHWQDYEDEFLRGSPRDDRSEQGGARRRGPSPFRPSECENSARSPSNMRGKRKTPESGRGASSVPSSAQALSQVGETLSAVRLTGLYWRRSSPLTLT